MCVEVHETGTDDVLRHIDRALRGIIARPYRDYPTVPHADISACPWRARAVYDGASPQQQVQHNPTPIMLRRPHRRQLSLYAAASTTRMVPMPKSDGATSGNPQKRRDYLRHRPVERRSSSLDGTRTASVDII
jgi:hypothetical protein